MAMEQLTARQKHINCGCRQATSPKMTQLHYKKRKDHFRHRGVKAVLSESYMYGLTTLKFAFRGAMKNKEYSYFKSFMHIIFKKSLVGSNFLHRDGVD